MLSPSAEVWRSKAEAIAWADRAMTIAILGQNLTTDVQGGSYAAARVHEAVRADLLEADVETLATGLRNGVLALWAEWNAGDPALAPWPRWDPRPPEDLAARAETLQRLAQAVATFAQAGANVDLDALLEEYGLPVRKGQGLVRLASGDPPQEAPGFVQGQLYADALADRLLSRLPDPLAGLEAELAQAQSYEEVRGLLMRRFREASPEEVAALTERALTMAALAGRYGVIRDVER